MEIRQLNKTIAIKLLGSSANEICFTETLISGQISQQMTDTYCISLLYNKDTSTLNKIRESIDCFCFVFFLFIFFFVCVCVYFFFLRFCKGAFDSSGKHLSRFTREDLFGCIVKYTF